MKQLSKILILIICGFAAINAMDLSIPSRLTGLEPDQSLSDAANAVSAGPGPAVRALPEQKAKVDDDKQRIIKLMLDKLALTKEDIAEFQWIESSTAQYHKLKTLWSSNPILQIIKSSIKNGDYEAIKALAINGLNNYDADKTSNILTKLVKVGNWLKLNDVRGSDKASLMISAKFLEEFKALDMMEAVSKIMKSVDQNLLIDIMRQVAEGVDVNLMGKLHTDVALEAEEFFGLVQKVFEDIKKLIVGLDLKAIGLRYGSPEGFNHAIRAELLELGIDFVFDFAQLLDVELWKNPKKIDKALKSLVFCLFQVVPQVIPQFTPDKGIQLVRLLMDAFQVPAVFLLDCMDHFASATALMQKIIPKLPMIKESIIAIGANINFEHIREMVPNVVNGPLAQQEIQNAQLIIFNIFKDLDIPSIQEIIMQEIKKENNFKLDSMLHEFLKDYNWQFIMTADIIWSPENLAKIIELKLLLFPGKFDEVLKIAESLNKPFSVACISENREKYIKMLFNEISGDANVHIVKFFLDKLSEHVKGPKGLTPLNAAIKSNKLELVKMLLDRDATSEEPILLTEPDEEGNGPIDNALRCHGMGKPEIFALLIQLAGREQAKQDMPVVAAVTAETVNSDDAKSAGIAHVSTDAAAGPRTRKTNVCDRCAIL